ncbi:conserved hypothetical protein [Uncinocarpus reesii 1704]|uniref:FAM192A/Fyv6 N-terminal domain-containing protein n=1 Tax=Uncinocarpus reesii (strain UAMH 1704) TaxID=336963 RepID=C4JQX0_UNCRE|nr:uncharacterized protein UREG_03452 [Uncinocarpus reesii 1704]EEP78606.1 conserved hypothetical protein [Uncinocarpus reesii 1704]
MSSGFVSGDTTEYTPANDGEWQKVKQELEASRKRRAEQQGTQEGGKSLYDILQQNKAAKQEAFEESIRLKNQFRALDEDEVEFLDSLLESTRAKEAAVQKETMEQLELFHRQREEAEKKAFLEENGPDHPSGGLATEEEQWVISNKKRRRAKENDTLQGVKLRKSSTTTSLPPASQRATAAPGVKIVAASDPQAKEGSHCGGNDASKLIEPQENAASLKAPIGTKPAAAVSSALGLGAYSSDDD